VQQKGLAWAVRAPAEELTALGTRLATA